GYELKAECGSPNAHRAQSPDAVWLYATRFLAFDHHACATYLLYVRRRESCADASAESASDTCAEAETWFDATERRLRSLPRISTTLPVLARTKGTDPLEFHLRRPYASSLVEIPSFQR